MKKKKLSPLAAAIVEGLNEAISYVNGEHVQGLHAVEVEVPDVKRIRQKLDMTQEEFAVTFRIPSGTVKGWEQKRRGIDAPAAALLRVIELYPDKVKEAQEKKLPELMEA